MLPKGETSKGGCLPSDRQDVIDLCLLCPWFHKFSFFPPFSPFFLLFLPFFSFLFLFPLLPPLSPLFPIFPCTQQVLFISATFSTVLWAGGHWVPSAASGTHRPLHALLFWFHTELTAVGSHPDTLTCLWAESGLWISYWLSFSCANQNKTNKQKKSAERMNRNQPPKWFLVGEEAMRKFSRRHFGFLGFFFNYYFYHKNYNNEAWKILEWKTPQCNSQPLDTRLQSVSELKWC